MSLNLSKVKHTGGNFVAQEALDAGVYPARLVQIIALGLQTQRPYQGQEKPPAYEIMLTYELTDEFMKDEAGEDIEDKPRWVSETIPVHSLEADLAKSTKRYKSFDPELVHGGNFVECLGVPVNITLTKTESKGKFYNNVANTATMRPKDAAKAPELVNPSKFFDLEEPDLDVFETLPDWIKEKITSNLEFNGSKLQALLGGKKPEAPKEVKKEEPAAWEDDTQGEDTPY